MSTDGPFIGALLCGLMASAAPAQTLHSHDARGGAPQRTASAPDTAATAAFAHAARMATQPYQDRAAAIADGFRLLGPDFPAMGEHWVHPGRMVDGTLDVRRPQALSYAHIDGRPVLVGVIYARPLRSGERPPDFPLPALPWHDHVGAIDDESVVLQHVPSDTSGRGVRLAMLHVWVWIENPDGVFAPDNWALPFARLHLDRPARINTHAARALSLAAGGDAYYTRLFHALVSPTADEATSVQQRIRDARAGVTAWHSRRAGRAAPLDDAEQAALAAMWTSLWSDAAALVRPEAAARMHVLITP